MVGFLIRNLNSYVDIHVLFELNIPIRIDFRSDDDETNENSAKLTTFFKTSLAKHNYFSDRYLQSVDKF